MPETTVYGMMVDTDPFDVVTSGIMNGTAKLLETDLSIRPEDLHLRDVCGPGYAIASVEGNEAIRMMATQEGLFLDPVYTGKAFGGLIAMAREGAFAPEDNVLFIYSGGAGGLFAVEMNFD